MLFIKIIGYPSTRFYILKIVNAEFRHYHYDIRNMYLIDSVVIGITENDTIVSDII